MSTEIWMPIDGYQGYLVSNLGRIKSVPRFDRLGRNIPGGIRKIWVRKDGYCFIHLSKNGKKTPKNLGRLVAAAFIPNPLRLPEVNHKDGDKQKNSTANLEWVSKSENIAHSYRELGREPNRPCLGRFGIAHHRARPIVGENHKTGEVVRFDSFADAKRAGFHSSDIMLVIHGRRKTHKGFCWGYACLK